MRRAAFLVDCGDDSKPRNSGAEEIKRLVSEFESSGLGLAEFCRKTSGRHDHLSGRSLSAA
jgi:hypothetical protein